MQYKCSRCGSNYVVVFYNITKQNTVKYCKVCKKSSLVLPWEMEDEPRK